MRAVICARYSSSSQREESIECQVKECAAYAERNGYTVIGTYADRAISAAEANTKGNCGFCDCFPEI